MPPPPPRRARLRPWLVAQVSSRRFPGLRWLDPQRRRFVIPWGHATRNPPAPPGHLTIFKAWAQYTGKLRGGAGAAPARWKANLRCALNKSREFRLLFDGPRARPARPFRVYELCHGHGADGAPEDDCDSDEEEDDVSQLQKLTALSINDPQRGGDPLPPAPPCSGCPPGPFAPPPPPELLPGEGGGTHGPPELPPAPLGQAGPPPERHVPDLLVSPHVLPLTDLELQFHYRGRPVCALTVSNPHGCRLFHSRLAPARDRVDLFGPPTLEQVPFPAADAVPNEKQRFYTRRLLAALDRGLVLELQGRDLFALRLCQCKVFWTGPCAPPRAGPNPLERDKKTKLFSLEGFLNGLILFQKGRSSTPPPFEIFLCFGEEWPDHKPKEKKLITVQVVPVAARLLLEMFSGELSWSADSVPLHISHPDLGDQMVEQLKELQRLWQDQHRLPPQPPQPPQPPRPPQPPAWPHGAGGGGWGTPRSDNPPPTSHPAAGAGPAPPPPPPPPQNLGGGGGAPPTLPFWG